MDDPGFGEIGTLFEEGGRCLQAMEFLAAADCYRRALALEPDLAEAHLNLGVALERAGATAAAESSYARSLDLDPGLLDGHLNLGALLVDQGRFGEAEAIYRRALEQFPDAPGLWSNLAVLCACTDRHDEAERCCRSALALDGEHARARYNLSYLLLRQGRFEEGWPVLEARAWSQALNGQIPAPRWQGEGPQGRSLLIGPEAGLGDMIQFSRYVPVLKEQGAVRIGIICPPSLKRLFLTLPGIDAVVATGEPVPDLGWDAWTLPLSLPRLCGTRLESIPAPIPYLRAEAGLVQAWRSRLGAAGLRVGLAWKGNPKFENDRDRSLPSLDTLGPLAAIEGIQFVSLQVGAGEAGRPPRGMDLFDPSPWIGDFADTAALIANLDLVISVDTAVAHLAGALGKPCWVLLPHFKTDWRWLLDRTDSPWYPGVLRLFRQTTRGGWGPVIEAVAAALAAAKGEIPSRIGQS